MADQTNNYGLQKLVDGEAFSLNDHKFTNRDRDIIDQLMYAAEIHQHTGVAGSALVPDPPSLTQAASGGTIPSGTTVYYVITLVDPTGFESSRSTEAQITTPAALANPDSVVLSTATTGGTLVAGQYAYAVSAYTNASTEETRAPNSALITVPATTATNENTLTLPTLPAGADGFNVYRRAPGQNKYFYLASVDMTVATPPTTYEDDGAVEEDCDRTLPSVNTTNNTNMITVTYPGVTPSLPTGYTWKIYRTYSAAGDGRWSSSLLHHVTEQDPPGYIDIDVDDTGFATQTGSPPATSLAVDSPSKIDLDDGNEVQNKLPIGHVQAFPYVVQFTDQGSVSVQQGTLKWVCPFPLARIIECQAVLGVGSTPASTDVIVDVNKGDNTVATPYLTTIYSVASNPTIPVGSEEGTAAAPDTTWLTQGQFLTVDVDQAGGGATPTDEDLVVQIYMLVQFSNTTSDFAWS